jgi:ATP-dependent helicase/nuclease subunit A
MSSLAAHALPPDQADRARALDAGRSVLVQAPAGSGKTDLLTRRFLRLLGEVDDPGEIVAITFTKAAAAEMRHRIVAELEKAAGAKGAEESSDPAGELSMNALAARALERSLACGWNLVELPAQLRITTIDAFCREIAIQQPLLSGLGGALDIFEDQKQLYRRAARRTLEHIGGQRGGRDAELQQAIESLLLWRDNSWREMEDLLVEMLAQRDRWMQDFVFDRETDWELLRERLERPFARAVRRRLEDLSNLLDHLPEARIEALELARFACTQTGGALHQELAELAEFPAAPFDTVEQLEEARQACACLANLLLTGGRFRRQADKRLGFPAHAKAEKNRLYALIADLRQVPGLEQALAAAADLPPARYTEEDWAIIRACFVLLRHAAAELKVTFAEAAATDYTEVAQIAAQVLRSEEGAPGDAAMSIADGIRHLLIDEFQDTSRRQHQLLSALIAAWPEREGRTCFVVGDPMQSIYFFRDADAELFSRVRDYGLEAPGEEPLRFDYVRLSANFRTAAELVEKLNEAFAQVFAADDGSGVTFARAEAVREAGRAAAAQRVREAAPRMQLHLAFMPRIGRGAAGARALRDREECAQARSAALNAQLQRIVQLIRDRDERIGQARAHGEDYRIAVLGRTRKALASVAEALRAAAIPFRAVELEPLKDRPEVLDALALARALANPHDRVAWLGVLRAPWCGLSLADLHALVSADDAELRSRPVPELMGDRAALLSEQGREAVARVQRAVEAAAAMRAVQPTAALGTWLEQVWLQLGGDACVDAAARANLDLLWECLDGLPEGEQDISGAALAAALDRLMALPDPGADSRCGVQLMTIHKAKGLEFEVVIVPELQAGSAKTRGSLLSWLERGLSEADEPGEATEFLVAPISPKGVDRGSAKAWVDCVRSERETQELRRLLYVAGTRAREELHLFARPEYRQEADGSLSLAAPKPSLLSAAWPALESEVRRQFAEWIANGSAKAGQPASIDSIAASEDNLLQMRGAAGRPTVLHRLPLGFHPARPVVEISGDKSRSGLSAEPFYRRHEGGLISRALGIAVHRLLQELARLRISMEWEPACAALRRRAARVAAEVRGMGIAAAQAEHLAAQALELARAAARDSLCRWILSPHADAASEVRWTGFMESGFRTVQADRIFRAGIEPGSHGVDAWWIIDYKTALADGLDSDKALAGLRELFAPQLAAYARVLRNLQGAETRIFAGLYYPRMSKFDWWEA